MNILLNLENIQENVFYFTLTNVFAKFFFLFELIPLIKWMSLSVEPMIQRT